MPALPELLNGFGCQQSSQIESLLEATRICFRAILVNMHESSRVARIKSCRVWLFAASLPIRVLDGASFDLRGEAVALAF